MLLTVPVIGMPSLPTRTLAMLLLHEIDKQDNNTTGPVTLRKSEKPIPLTRETHLVRYHNISYLPFHCHIHG